MTDQVTGDLELGSARPHNFTSYRNFSMAVENFAKLKEFSDRLGLVYGMEDFPLFLYSLVKMQKPEQILELGAGLGVSTFWMAQACEENDRGTIVTVDNGEHWPDLLETDALPLTEEERSFGKHRDYFHHMTEHFGFSDRILLLEDTVPPYPTPKNGEKIDICFSDFDHRPEQVILMFAALLPYMQTNSHIFIDSAPTYFASYQLLENLMGFFNKGQIPLAMREQINQAQLEAAETFVRHSRFILVNITEARGGAQNSTAWVKIEPLDVRPQPFTEFH